MVDLNKSIPYDLNVNPFLSQESLAQLDPIKLEQAKYTRGGASVGPEVTQQYVEKTLAPEINKDSWSKDFAFKRAQIQNKQILGQEQIDVGRYELDTRKSLFKGKLIGKIIGDAIKMSAAAYGGYKSSQGGNVLAGIESAGIQSPNSYIPMSSFDIAKGGNPFVNVSPSALAPQPSFFDKLRNFSQTPMGGATMGLLSYSINPENFGQTYAKMYR